MVNGGMRSLRLYIKFTHDTVNVVRRRPGPETNHGQSLIRKCIQYKKWLYTAEFYTIVMSRNELKNGWRIRFDDFVTWATCRISDSFAGLQQYEKRRRHMWSNGKEIYARSCRFWTARCLLYLLPKLVECNSDNRLDNFQHYQTWIVGEGCPV